MKFRQILIAIVILGTVWHSAAAQPKKKTTRQMRLRRRAFLRVQACSPIAVLSDLIALKPEMPLGPQDVLKSYEIAMSLVAEKTSADFSVIVQAQQTNQITRRTGGISFAAELPNGDDAVSGA